jgi:UDP-N-acetylmuramate dehydrogenase
LLNRMLSSYTPDVPLAPYTTFHVGGAAEYFARVATVAQLRAALAEASAARHAVTILGGGSNVLVADGGVAGCVIKNEITGWEVLEHDDSTVMITVGAGMVWDELVARTVESGWWGLENLSAIPGTVGATPIQNVGAYGVEVAARVVMVDALHQTTGAARQFTAAECAFGYRDSHFKTLSGREWVITAVTFRLDTQGTPQLQYRDLAQRFVDQTPTQAEVREAVIAIRAAKFPDWHQVGTAGSFFKNPIIPVAQYERLLTRYADLPKYPTADGQVKVPLGWILDNVCALRGVYDGPVGCYEGQALVLVNTGGADAARITTFAAQVAAAVYEKTGLTIEWEVTPVG